MLLASVRRMKHRKAKMGSKETREEDKATFQMRDNCDTGSIRGGGERWLDMKYILMVEQSGLDDLMTYHAY